ncbi:MAG: hypothetical protein R3F56_25100 [Planctomycetota bacterium]
MRRSVEVMKDGGTRPAIRIETQTMNHTPLRTLFLLGLPVAAASAQSAPQVIGLSPTEFHRFDNACGGTACPSPLPPSTLRYAGGTAHDPRDRQTWISNGTLLAKIDPRSTSCAVTCAPFPAPDLVPGEVVTGLACNEQTGRLFVSHSDNRILTYDAVSCALTLVSTCSLSVPANHIVSGLATDDVNGLLFYATSPWLGPGLPPEVTTALQASPCSPTCPPFNVPACNGPVQFVTGLGFDPCRSVLHVTDGAALFRIRVVGCTQTFLNCCYASLSGPQIGLCFLPSTEVSSGNVCFTGSVTPCSAMAHTLVGDPTIGNLGFGLALDNAPAGTLAIVNLNVGGCAPSTTYGVLCTGVPSFWFAFGWTPSTGGTGCGGSAFWPVPLPPSPTLCGVQLSTRWFGVAGALTNNYVSNCLTWAISGS